jgi:LmbE family N-acetylglucosaminyl deacetylase
MTGDDLAARWRAVHDRAVPWSPPPVPTLVVVPHPDDEVLMAGGLIAVQRAAGVAVTVVAVTDGEAAYPGQDLPVDLAAVRRREQVAALAELGAPEEAIVRVGLPDGGVAAHVDDLTGRLVDLAAGHELLVAPWTRDHHTDHEACGAAGRAAAAATGLPLVQSLFWTWHHRDPHDLDDLTVLGLGLDDALQARRRRAMAHHASQVAPDLVDPPLLGADDLAPLGWPVEHHLREGPGA